MHKLSLILALFLNINLKCFSQKILCDTFYSFTENKPIYKGGEKDLLKFFQYDLSPTMTKCKDSTSLGYTLKIKLTINKMGEVIDAAINADMPAACKDQMVKQLLAMKGWSPAIHKNKAVCSHFHWPIHIHFSDK